VVIVGGGFAGLAAARGLRRSPVRITLIDRQNHHLFQPLLYQVATAALSPANIAQPIRKVFSRQRNMEVVMGEVTSIDAVARVVRAGGREYPYDWLVLASGARDSYFGNDGWRALAPPLKTIDDALEIRRRFLAAFERAELEPDDASRRAALTFVIVGGGPTGVEMAGAMAELTDYTIRRDFRAVDTATARIVLVEGRARLLAQFHPELSEIALQDLQDLGVEVMLNAMVTGIDAHGVTFERGGAAERIDTPNVVWAAGVRASPLGALLGAPTDSAGRVRVEPDLSVPGRPEALVVGDLAHAVDQRTGEEVPGMAPGAMQMGRHAAEVIDAAARARVAGRPEPARSPFLFRDKGMMATIGRNRAVAQLAGRRFGGMLAWLLWAGVHIFYLIGFRSKVLTMIDWAWSYIFFERGARLITGLDWRRAEEADEGGPSTPEPR